MDDPETCKSHFRLHPLAPDSGKEEGGPSKQWLNKPATAPVRKSK